MTLLQSGIAKPSSGYDIDQSLRFDDGDSAYMTRTPSSAGNQKTWTYSGWIKKGNDVTEQLFTTDVGTTSTTYGSIALHSSGYFYVGEYSQNFRQTTQLFRDPSAWYHFVVAFDTTESTGSNRVKVYVNGEQITDFSTSNDPTQDADYAWNNTNRHDIGSEKGTGNFFDGYMAEVHFIDGQALTPASFGETNSATNQWVPIEVTGMTYGTNGLYLPFSSTELADSFTDSSKSAVDSSDRESEIAVTSSFTWLFTSSGNTDGEDLVNGLVTNNDAGGGWMPSGDVTDRWIKFDFGSGKVYTKCQWISINSTGSEGTWKWQGSNNDSDWTDIGGTFTLGGADGGSNVTYTLGDTLSGNTTSYRYYRILGTTGSANTSGRRLAMYFGGWSDGIGHTITANGDVANVRTPFYKSESFTTVESTTWTAPAGITSVEYLVVAGGGEGGWDAGGGGGAGGYRTGTLSVTPGASYTVTVGAGGTSTQSGSSKYGADGDNSVFSSITSTGGGGGGSTSSSISGRAGGSGGGGGGYNASGGSGGAGNAGSFSPVEGNVGGAGASGATTAGGGGGGSSSAGATGGSPTSAGGDGTSNSITGSAVTYAAGGQGNSDSSGSNTSGAANTGNGGNGGAGTPQGGAGGSGIVVLKWGSGFGKDSSGEGNDFAETNLVATDQVLDSPTNNFTTFNSVCKDSNAVLSEGNLKIIGSAHLGASVGTIGASAGKWYWEMVVVTSVGGYIGTGIAKETTTDAIDSLWAGGTDSISYYADGKIYNNGSTTSTSMPTYAVGDIIGIAVDLDNYKLYFSKNNSWINSGDPTSGSTGTGSVATPASVGWLPVAHGSGSSSGYVANFGQDSSFAGTKTAQGNGGVGEDFYYTPPTDFKALNTDNLDDPAITLPTDHFNTLLYDDGAGAKTGVGFQPDLVWVKSRGSTYEHELTDSVRGVTKALSSDNQNAETTDSTGLTAFGADGFTVGADTNYSDTTGSGMVAWSWKAGTTFDPATAGNVTTGSGSADSTSGFSIVKYTGEGSAMTLGHGLSQAPELIIVKCRDSGEAWNVYAEPISSTPAEDYLVLNLTNALATNDTFWNDTPPTATVFTVGHYDGTNKLDDDYIAYCFHSVDAYSKVGSYAGNANADGSFIYTGFRPAFVLAKSYDYVYTWPMVDNKRGSYNVITKGLAANSSDAELDNVANSVDFLSNGFKFRNSHTMFNGSHNYIYLAIAESPFKTSNAR